MKKVAVVPVKLNNDRFPGKNTKSFDHGYPLIQYLLRTLDECLLQGVIAEAYCYCSDKAVKNAFPPGTKVKFLERDKVFDSPQATSNGIIREFVKTVFADIYVLAHVTCPFTSVESIKMAIDFIESGVSDSSIACRKIQTFLFDESSTAVNFDVANIPRTQDLPALYAPTTGLWAFSHELAANGLTIGKHPVTFEVPPMEAVDIDYEEDFEMANCLWNGLRVLNHV